MGACSLGHQQMVVQDAERFEACADHCAEGVISDAPDHFHGVCEARDRGSLVGSLAPESDGVARPERRLSGSGEMVAKAGNIGVDAAEHGDGRGCWTGHGASLSVDERLAIRERSGIYAKGRTPR
jgi:hypothetical protein